MDFKLSTEGENSSISSEGETDAPRENYRMPVCFKCNCSKDRMLKALATIKKSDLQEMIDDGEDVEVVFPVHKNPKVREVVREELGGLEKVHLIDPLDYEPFANLMSRAHLILTDSGGVQEEAPALGKPVLVLRDTTERPEAVAAGTVKLIGTDRERVYQEAKTLLEDPAEYGRMAESVNPYGDGKASERIIQAILYHYGLAENRPDVFKGK